MARPSRETMSRTGSSTAAAPWFDLGSLGGISEALAINDRGQIVGLSSNRLGIEGIQHATLWENGQIVDLNDLIPAGAGWTLELASGVNNRGQIVGYGVHDGRTQPFLLTP